MTETLLKAYGFEYPYRGKKFALHVEAESMSEAEARVAAMMQAQCVGALIADESAKPENASP